MDGSNKICSMCSPKSLLLRSKSTTAPSSIRELPIPSIFYGLEASFVSVPSSPQGIIDLNRKEWHGSEMYAATRRMEAMLTSAEEMVGSVYDGSFGGYCCRMWLDRIGRALDEQSSLLLDECVSYNEAASREEERVDSIRRALAGLMQNVSFDGGTDEGSTDWALEQFYLEIEALQHAYQEQTEEVEILQNLMQEQQRLSKTLSFQEEAAFQELNALERDVHNFNEESHHVGNMCSSVLNEIDALSRVKVISTQFCIELSNNNLGCYPLINNLRLAYRTNAKANLQKDEINAAWVQAAQLVAFTCALYPDFHMPTISIIPLTYPCAKIQMLIAPSSGGDERKHFYNLGWDILTSADQTNHIPSPSLVTFLSLMSHLVSHILEIGTLSLPPFEMAEASIDGVDVTKLLESDTWSWLAVVYCISGNLQWLSYLPIKLSGGL